MSIDHGRGEIVLAGSKNEVPLNLVDHLELSSFADEARGYRELGLSLVLSTQGKQPKGSVFLLPPEGTPR